MDNQKKSAYTVKSSDELRKQLTHLVENNKLANGIHKIATIKLQKILSDKKTPTKQSHRIESIDANQINCWHDKEKYHATIDGKFFTFPSPWIENDLDKKFQILANISEAVAINEINISTQISSETLLFVLIQKLFNRTSTPPHPQIINDHITYLQYSQTHNTIDISDDLKVQHKSLSLFTLIRAIFKIVNNTAPSISFYDLAVVLIKNPHFQAVTFDFFDTISYRTSDDPQDIFILAGREMLERHAIPAHITPTRFRKLRAKAESIAREHATNHECTIHEIYHELTNHISGLDVAQAIEIEIDTEVKNSIINKDVIDLINLANRHNKKIAIISDTYLGKSHLRRILGKEYASLFEHIFTSSEHRSGKTQTLHSIAHKKLGTLANRCLHFGDNYVADVEKSVSTGATALLLPNGINEIHQIRAREEKLFKSRITQITAKTRSAFFASQLKVSHHASLSMPWNHFTYGAYVLGPIYGSYVLWAHRKIAEGNFDQVFFAMREGYLIHKIFAALPSVSAHKKDVYISRKKLFRASLTNLQPEDVSFAFSTSRDADIESKLSLLNLSTNDISPVALSLPEYDFCHYLLSDERIKHLISVRSAELRTRLMRHLFGEDYRTCPKRIALLDLGWNTTIQRLLNKCLEIENLDASIFGFYLMTTGAADEYDIPGKSVSQGYLVDAGEPHDLYRALSRNLEILEQCCNPPHGTVVDYLENGTAQVSSSCLSLAQLEDIAHIQAGVLKYVKHVQDIGEAYEAETVREIVTLKLLRAMLHPTESEIQLFERWTHDDNLFNTKTRHILYQYESPEVSNSSISKTLRKPFTEVYWNSGSIAKFNQDLGELSMHAELLSINTRRLFFK